MCSTSLAEGTAWVEAQLGVPLQPGGQHPAFGTHNTLLGLGDVYLEVIARDPDAAPVDHPTWFGLDEFTGPARLGNWICRMTDITMAPAVVGPPMALTRGDLNWQITVPKDGSLPYAGAYPTLIEWAKGTHHPADRLPDSGVRLTRWDISHPDAAILCDLVKTDDPRIHWAVGPAGFRATFDTPNGPRVLT